MFLIQMIYKNKNKEKKNVIWFMIIPLIAESVENYNFAAASYYTNVPSVGVDLVKELVRFFYDSGAMLIWNS